MVWGAYVKIDYEKMGWLAYVYTFAAVRSEAS
jgi:hypothetical protein